MLWIYNSSITKDKQVSTLIIFAVIILAIILKAVVGFIIVRMIVNPIKEIQGLMENAENGDLTVNGKYVSKDELGQLTVSFNRMMHRLRDLMKQVNITSEQVAASLKNYRKVPYKPPKQQIKLHYRFKKSQVEQRRRDRGQAKARSHERDDNRYS